MRRTAKEKWLREKMFQAATAAAKDSGSTAEERHAYVVGYLKSVALLSDDDDERINELLGIGPRRTRSDAGFRGDIAQAVDP
jgi:hypothetical protein